MPFIKQNSLKIEYLIVIVLLLGVVVFMKLISSLSQIFEFIALWWMVDIITFPVYIPLSISKKSLKIGHIWYNIVHSFTFAAVFFISVFIFTRIVYWLLVIAWCMHISFDRTLGFGFKDQNEKVPSRLLNLILRKLF